VALHGTDVFTDFRSCVLCCSQFALNVRVQSPEGIREGDVLQMTVVIFGS
jgi:hypothetical protein